MSSAAAAAGTSRAPVAAVAALAAVTGVALLAWQLSPAASLLGHGSDNSGRAAAAMVVWFTLSWLLMASATMLPTSIPLVTAFGRVVGDRSGGGRLVAIVVGAYLAVWAAAGLTLSGFDAALHIVVEHSPLRDHAPLVLAATLAVAGAYQLSARSDRCLRTCRSPFSFLATRWTGTRPASSEATLVGIDYGVSCLGCCAALMLVMFAAGMTNPLIMIALGGVAAAHKLAPWGPTLARVTGGILLATAAVVAAVHLVRIA